MAAWGRPPGEMAPLVIAADELAPGGMPPVRMPPAGMPLGGLAPWEMAPAGMAPGGMAPGGLAPWEMAPGGVAPGGLASWEMAPGGMPLGRLAPWEMAPGGVAPGGVGAGVMVREGRAPWGAANGVIPARRTGGRRAEREGREFAAIPPGFFPGMRDGPPPGPPRRNLAVGELGSVIFGCTNATFNECVTNNIFGLPRAHRSYVEQIVPGMPIFLYNYSERRLYGVFEAVSAGALNIDPEAFNGRSEVRRSTSYPAQVCVRLRFEFANVAVLSEHFFRGTLRDNYFSPSHFHFEVDQIQTRELVDLFRDAAAGIIPLGPPGSPNDGPPDVRMDHHFHFVN